VGGASTEVHFVRGCVRSRIWTRGAGPDTVRRLLFALQRGGNRVIGWIVLGVLVLAVVLTVTAYNRLVELRNRYKNAFSQIDVQLKRRYDLIPNLVETAKGYLRHERQTLEAVIAARNQASTAAQRAAAAPGDATAMRELVGAETALGGALGRMFALAEAYPDLKSNTTMNQLSEELSSTENKVAFARQAYNDAVMAYNTGREIFPTSIIAGAAGFAEARLWEIERAVEREAVKVSFA
jgi:LemA protein